MRKLLFVLFALMLSFDFYSQTETFNNSKINVQSSSSVSLFQSQSTNGVWGSGMIVGDRWSVFEDATSSKERLTIIPNGNVGIGTNAPDAKLTVKGDIHTREIKVDLNGVLAPDYVFLDDYKLKSISEVEKYIKGHGHLPNIPSAIEMEENGIKLKQMNLKLLEKIEELTLYTIAQEKRIKQLEKKEMEHKTLAVRLTKIEALLEK